MENCTANITCSITSGSPVWLFFGVVIALLIACIFCNGIIIAVFIAERSLRNQANMFVLSLACADLVVGLVSMPLWIANSDPEKDLDYYLIAVDILCCVASIFSCALLSIERAMKITLPYWYTNNVTASRIKLVIALAWITAVLVASFSFLRGEDENNVPYIIFVSIFTYVLPVLVICFSYTSIFYVAHEHARSIRMQNSRIAGSTSTTRISEAKTAWRLGVFVIVFIICWTPHFVKLWWPLLLEDVQPPITFKVVAILLANINAVINPFLYAIFNPAFRKGMAKLYKKEHRTCLVKESSRKNEISTANTNLNNSPSISRIVSSHCSPQAERREPAFKAMERWRDQINRKLRTLPENSTNNEKKSYLFETSL